MVIIVIFLLIEKITGIIRIQNKILKKKADLSPLKNIIGMINRIIVMLKILIKLKFLLWRYRKKIIGKNLDKKEPKTSSS